VNFTPREQVADVWPIVKGMTAGRVRGADQEVVRADRLAFLDRAEVLVEKALAGPPRCWRTEPDDAALHQMRAAIQQRRDQISATR
jgi:hypothetical protein